MERFTALIKLLLIPILLLAPSGIAAASPSESKDNTLHSVQTRCIEYDSIQKLIQVKCEAVHLTDIYNSLSNPIILGVENGDNGPISGDNDAKVWILNAGIVVHKSSSLIIDSTDTSWLKIIPTATIQLKQKTANITEEANYSDDTLTVIKSNNKSDDRNMNSTTKVANGTIVVSKNNGDNPNGIHVHGSLKIDSVKVTSWNPEKNDVIEFDFGKRPGEEHTKSKYDTAEPRAFIRVSKDATGTTNITNSEIAYLGYSCSRCAGLSYYGGEGSVIKNNDIHHLLKGFYSKAMGEMVIEDNKFHDNYLYGIDPHTGSHDMVIRNNKVYANNASGIICSKDCYNILIEGNEVYRNGGVGRGIAFSINTTNSIARNNDVHNNERCISFNRESNYNQVYNNSISNCDIGIYLSNTSKNFIYNNNIVNSKFGIVIKEDITNNIRNNLIDKTGSGITLINKNTNSTDLDTELYNEREIILYLDELKSTNKLLDISNPIATETDNVKGLKDLLKSLP